MAYKYVKLTTNLTGMAVSRNPIQTLGLIYSKTLKALDKMPADYPYRKHTEQIVKERAQLAKNNPNILKLEKEIDCGQIEEIIIQANNELNLARRILEWRSWEPLVNEPPKNQWKWPM